MSHLNKIANTTDTRSDTSKGSLQRALEGDYSVDGGDGGIKSMLRTEAGKSTKETAEFVRQMDRTKAQIAGVIAHKESIK